MRRKHSLVVFIVIFSFISFTACQKDNIPVSPNADGFLSFERTIKTGLVDYGNHVSNNNFREFIANHFDYVITGENNLDFDFYRNINPDIQIFSYWNSIFLSLNQQQPIVESAYLHDLSTPGNENDSAKRIGRIFESEFFYVMDDGNADWQFFSLNSINQALSNGFDGVLLDDVFAHLMHEAHFNVDEPYTIGQPDNFTTFSTLPSWYNAQQSHDAYQSYISYLNDNISGKIIFNGINDLAENLQPIDELLHPKGYLQVSAGSVQEGFVYNGLWVSNPEDGFFGDEYWEGIVEILINIPLDKLHGVVSYGDVNYFKGRIYSFASFLLGYNTNGKASYYFAPNEFTLTYLPEWNLNIGNPVESYLSIQGYKDLDNNVFSRKYENALIIVNPYAAATNLIALDKDYFLVGKASDIDVNPMDGRIGTAIGANNHLKFEPVSSIQLEGYSAVILMRTK